MNTISDINKNMEPLSLINGEKEGRSILNSLFSISFDNEEILSENDLIDKEFLFEEDDIKIIDFISNIIPDFNNKKNNLSGIGKIENTIKLDTNLSKTEKNKILNFIKLGFTNLKEIKLGLTSLKETKLEISSNKNFKHLLTENPLKSSSSSLENVKPLKNEKSKINLNNPKTINNVYKGSIDNNFEEKKVNDLQNQQSNKFKKPSTDNQHLAFVKKSSIKNQTSEFVKKIKKNNHPNKIYDLAKVSTVEQNQFKNSQSQFETKISTNITVNQLNSQISESSKKNNINETKTNDIQKIGFQQSNQINNITNNYSNNINASFSKIDYNSVLENFLDNLDLTQKGWTSKLASRIEGSLVDGGGEIEFNLKPKNLGMLKISVTLKEGIGSVKIITENSFVTTALNQNENYLQKLFNDQGINLEFLAKNESQNFGSQNNFNQNSNNKKESKHLLTEKNIEEIDENNTQKNSSRHIINVIA